MKLPQGTELERRRLLNSGRYSIVMGFSGSGTNPDYSRTGGTADLAVSFAAPNATLSTAGDFYSGSSNLAGAGTYVGLSTFHISTMNGTASAPNDEAAKSLEQIAFEKRKARLIRALNDMKTSAPNWYSSATSRISDASAITAEKFLQCLPGNAVLPKVASDGEGDVMFVWDDTNHRCVVTVEPQLLHLVNNPGTPDAVQVDSQQFLGVRIPAAILEYIPSK